MTANEITAIRQKIENAKTSKARAEGQLETVKKTLKEKFGVSSVKEAKALIAATQEEETLAQAKLDTLYAELDGLTDWSQL